jgi:hypothetical protein
MSAFRLTSVDHPDAPSLEISARLRSQLAYFMTPSDAPHVPPLEANDYWIDADNAARWAEDGVFDVASPLDNENVTTVELSEEQEALFDWLISHRIQHLRLHEIS